LHLNEVALGMVLQNRYPDSQATHEFISSLCVLPNLVEGLTKLFNERQKSQRNFHKAAHRRLLGKVTKRLFLFITVYNCLQ